MAQSLRCLNFTQEIWVQNSVEAEKFFFFICLRMHLTQGETELVYLSGSGVTLGKTLNTGVSQSTKL